MKLNMVISLTVSFFFASQAMSFVSCYSSNSKDKPFTASFYETNNIKALVIDQNVSKVPFSYTCEKEELTIDEEKLVAYSCLGGSMFSDEEEAFTLYVNQSLKEANYYNRTMPSLARENLTCIFDQDIAE